MYLSVKLKTAIAFIFDIIVLLLAIYLPVFLRNGNILFNMYYFVFFIGWICLSFIFGKYRFNHGYLWYEITAILMNSIAVWGLLSLFIISFELFDKSYHLLFHQILWVTGIELSARILYYILNRKKYNKGKLSFFYHLHLSRNQWGLMFLNLLWVFLAFMFLVWLKPASLRIYIPNFYPFLIGLLIWELIINLFTGKHLVAKKQRFREFLIPILRTNILTLIMLAITVYLFHLFEYSRLIVFGTIVLSACFEAAFAFYISMHSQLVTNLDVSENLLVITPGDEKTARKDDQPLRTFPDISEPELVVKLLLEEQLSQQYKTLYDFIANHINLNGIPRKACSIFDTRTFFNIETREDASHGLLINLHKINNIKRINNYFALLNQKTSMGGYVVGCGKTIKGTYDEFLRRFPAPIGQIFYFFHFILRRVLPKIPVTREINYFLTRGDNRTLSKTEILGRLVYSGFKIVACFEIKDMLWFIAGKVNFPYKGEDPSYGPVISLKRVGKNKNIIKVYKFRTMHPYAEYIQDYVYQSGGGTIDGDGFQNDFRITSWGKILRKLWIDELPMLLNWLKGDLKLVGVRPLSKHKYSLLDKDLMEMRTKYLPGLVPPFYVDLPKSLKEFQDSERRYLEKYSKHKYTTDFVYFFKAFNNILIKGARSK